MKKNILWMVLTLVFPLVFNAVFFLAGGTDRKTSVWISYGFIHFAYLMLLLTPVFIRSDKSSAVFGFVLYTTTAAYFLLELVVGTLFILIPIFGPKTVLVIQFVIAGVYGIMLVAHMIANEKTADAQQARQVQIDYIKNASVELKLLLNRVQDKTARRKMERAYDALQSSPVKSHPELEKLERGLQTTIEAIEHAITAKNNERVVSLVEALFNDINERNARVRRL